MLLIDSFIPFQVIRRIKQLGLQLRITAYRPSDKKMSSTSFEFRYLEHNQDAECAYCTMLSTRSEVNKRQAVFCNGLTYGDP